MTAFSNRETYAPPMDMTMRRTEAPSTARADWHNIRGMLPYVWDYRGRVMLALATLMISKVAMVGVPILLKEIVDGLSVQNVSMLTLPLGLLLGYGALRLINNAFNELRDVIFARVRYHAMHRLSREVLYHLYKLSLRFHLDRKTGTITRDLTRGAQSVSSILNYLVFNIIPSIMEFALVAGYLLSAYPPMFAVVTLVTVGIYVAFTFSITNWRMHYRHEMNRWESDANGIAVDGLLNYETVKYFGNERYELRRYDDTLDRWEVAADKSQSTMSLLNFGQGAIIALGVTLIMMLAAQGVVDGTLTLGDLVLVNTMMLQLFLPLGFLGIIYRALRYALADMDEVFKLLHQTPEIVDAPEARPLTIGRATVRFDAVDFSYGPDRPILRDVSFEIRSGQKVAVVGPSGAGKSTLARLLFRFYDVRRGRVLIDEQDVRAVTQESLRAAIGIVPQDTVLFNDTLLQNFRYANPDATIEDIHEAARMADIHDFILSLPQGYDTLVGERGLKLSGGEKQRVAIARVILKRPRIVIFDEATSSLDTRSEQNILTALARVAQGTTTLVIAHRLSTVVDADEILVMDQGQIVQRGSHAALLTQGGLYAHLWQLQQAERAEEAAH
ncbi:MAG: ABCB family ABC transporter ATP-binding protein/permease [Thiotrichales bacterium]